MNLRRRDAWIESREKKTTATTGGRRRRSLRRDFEPCPRCGDDIRRGAVVCPFCGLDLEEQGDGYTRRASVRRDAEPHRGGTIQVLGILSLMGGVFYCLFPIGLPLGIAAWVMARRDLRKMDEGVMDPNGRKKTRDGRVCGIVGTVLNSGFALLALVVIFVIVLAESHSPPPDQPLQPPRMAKQPAGVAECTAGPQVNNFTLRVTATGRHAQARGSGGNQYHNRPRGRLGGGHRGQGRAGGSGGPRRGAR